MGRRCRFTLLVICLCAFAGTGIPASAAQSGFIPEIPLVIPDPGYESPNDPDLVYREKVLRDGRKYWGWGSALGKAISNFASIQIVLSGWDSSLRSAERAFWQDYARTGQVNPALRNEFAYWLHKRELWSSVLSNLKFAAKYSVGQSMSEVFTLIFGNNRPNAFTLPAEIGDIRTPTIEGPPRDYVNSPDYRAYFAQLSQHSYLLNCPCSPRNSDDPLDRIAYTLSFPFASIEAVNAKIAEIKVWSEGDVQKIGQLDKYLSEGLTNYRLSLDKWTAVDGYMEGRDPIAEQATRRFGQFFRIGTIFKHIDIDGPGGREGYIEMRNTKGFVDGVIIIAPQSHAELKRCIERNWNAIADFLFRLNGQRALAIMENPTMASIQFQRDLGHISIIGCSSPKGLSDERVPALLRKHGMI